MNSFHYLFRAWLVGLIAVVVACDSDDSAQKNITDQKKTARVPSVGHQKMVALLEEIKKNAPNEHRYVGDGPVRKMRSMITSLPESTPALKRAQMLYALADAELKIGEEVQAIERYRSAQRLFSTVKHNVRPDVAAGMLIEMDFSLGVAYMRLGETQNCCQRNTPDSCILPIRGSGIHSNTEGSLKAAEHFERVLRSTQPSMQFHQRALWLLNIAYMTLGKYPKDVPEEFLLPPESFESDEMFPRFVNVSSRLGVDTFSLAGGVVADDFDDDGDIDLLVSNWNTSGQIRYFSNAGKSEKDGQITFNDCTETAGLVGIFGGLNLVQADYDNDGRLDVLVLRGAWLDDKGHHPNSLLRNVGEGGQVVFSDVTFDAGLGELHYPTQTAAWADFDLDGDLDLYIGNESTPKRIPPVPSQLFQNQGNGTFIDIAHVAGVSNERYAKAVVWGDYDADGFPDLYVSNFDGANRLYRNNKDGNFTDVAVELGITNPSQSFPAWFWDYDNDGQLDLYASAYGADIADFASIHAGRMTHKESAKLYRNNGRGGFVDVTAETKLTAPSAPMGSNFGDLDNDGYLDFYLGTGYTAIFQLMPNVMYHNRGGKWFANVTVPGGFGHLQKGHAVAFADFDNDGDQDVFEQMGGAYLADKFHDALYENPGFGKCWIAFKLVGVNSNRSAIGARIRIDVSTGEGRRVIYRHVNSGGSFGANPLRQTIGLGDASEIERIEILWPRSGNVQHVKGVVMGRGYQIVEGESAVKPLGWK